MPPAMFELANIYNLDLQQSVLEFEDSLSFLFVPFLMFSDTESIATSKFACV